MPYYHDEWKSGEPTTLAQYNASKNFDRSAPEVKKSGGDFTVILVIGVFGVIALFYYVIMPIIAAIAGH